MFFDDDHLLTIYSVDYFSGILCVGESAARAQMMKCSKVMIKLFTNHSDDVCSAFAYRRISPRMSLETLQGDKDFLLEKKLHAANFKDVKNQMKIIDLCVAMVGQNFWETLREEFGVYKGEASLTVRTGQQRNELAATGNAQ